ncbi:glycoside hydrolase family 5 protein [Shinella curvata]|uniref:Glycoside hydrolase family 5 protein n=1 Tax=Shinella curvata TaxID=1817964 RepID=A0ABT8XJU8_9HYPH|nr:cellulase family glycosylhydrolase [Shinella curvata]MCJ8055944.1 glycoside hydrolase family 5 protein [Shinella curvata]MDO6123455.1 glycoside hydrolase family 5 protein [Shinella curvata]
MKPPGRLGGSGLFTRRNLLSLAGASVLAMAGQHGPARTKSSVPTRGINMPGWFDRPDGVAPTPAVLEKLRHRGFETVRLPIDGDLVLAGASNLLAIGKGIERLVATGFAVLADLHPAAALYTTLRATPLAGGKRVVEAWRVLSTVVADLPEDKVYPELLNEPPVSPADWLVLRGRLAEIVRAACPKHTIVWGPAPDQGIWQLAGMPPLDDDRQIAAVHFYAPTAFTHQCQPWGASPLARIHDLPFPATRDMPAVRKTIAALRSTGDMDAALLVEEQMTGDWTQAAIHAELRRAAEWSAATGCPLMLNEFGVLDFCVGAISRQTWIRAVRRAAEENGIGWAVWELDQGFGVIADRTDIEGFDDAMFEALFREGE